MSWRYDKNVLGYTSNLSALDFSDAAVRLVYPSVWFRVGIHGGLPEPEFKIHKGKVNKNNYIEWILRGSTGWVSVAFDGNRLVIEAFVCASTKGGKPIKILRAALRDRQKDGTGSDADAQTPLNSFLNGDPAFSRLPLPGVHIAEISIYSWDPDTLLPGIDQPGTVGHFIADPDYYTFAHPFDWTQYFQFWKEAVHLNLAPWQRGKPMHGVPRHFLTEAAKLAKEIGYDALDEVATWTNVADFFLKMGYRFTFGEHHLIYQYMMKIMEERFPKFSLYQQAWLVVLQNVPIAFIPDALRLNLPGHPELLLRWSTTSTNQNWVRMDLALSDRWKALNGPRLDQVSLVDQRLHDLLHQL